MKKTCNSLFVILLVLGLLVLNAPQNAEAASGVSHPGVAEGAWSTGTEVSIDLTVTSAPSWMQLLTNGVKISAPAKICHPFNGGRFGWVGEIRQLVKGNWVKLATTNDWFPDTEGEFMACAQAPAAGTYALFGYWIRPAGYVEEFTGDSSFDCSTVEWLSNLLSYTAESPNHFYYFPWFFNVPIGTHVTYKVTNMVPENNFTGALTGNGIITSGGLVNFGTDQFIIRVDSSVDSTVTTEFSLLGCTFTNVAIRNKLDD